MTESPLPNTTPGRGFNRRGFIRIAAGAAGAALATEATILSAGTANAAGPTPTLPGEISRLPNQVCAVGKKLYDNIEVNIKGDVARIFVPQTVKPKQAAPVGVVWFYHGSNSDSEAMNHGFKWNAERVVDMGSIAICQTAGGTQYSNELAQQIQLNGYAYMSGLFNNISVNYLRATSGGGALACGVYAKKLIPKINGLYMVNGLYDIYDAWKTEPRSVGPAFGNDEARIIANNPARATAVPYWSRSNVRVVVSDETNPDTLIPPAKNGLALVKKIKGTAKEASVRTHNLGHTTPEWATSDCIAAFKRWQLAL